MKYHDFLNVFFKEKADELSSHRKYNHKIELIDEKEASNRVSLYHMSKKELLLIKSYLKEHLEKDFIVVSLTSFVSLILFAKK